MHLSVITERVEDECVQCHSSPPIGVLQLTIFSKDSNGMIGPLCMQCLTHGEKKTDLDEPDVGAPNRKKAMRAQKKRSREQEVDLAEELGARVQKGSGAVSGAKGDIRKKGELRVEAKYTEAESYSLKLMDLHKILSECGTKEKPVFVVDYVEKGTMRLRDRYAVIPFEDLKELMDAASKSK